MPALLTPDGDCEGEAEGLAVGDCEGDGVGVGDGVAVGVGVLVGVGVAAGAFAMFAVIVPGPFMVAVVELWVGNANVMFPVVLDHEENL